MSLVKIEFKTGFPGPGKTCLSVKPKTDSGRSAKTHIARELRLNADGAVPNLRDPAIHPEDNAIHGLVEEPVSTEKKGPSEGCLCCERKRHICSKNQT